MKRLLNKSVDIRDITINVTCPICERTFDVTARGSSFTKTCRCNRGAFYITITNNPNELDVNTTFKDNFGNEKPVEPNDVKFPR